MTVNISEALKKAGETGAVIRREKHPAGMFVLPAGAAKKRALMRGTAAGRPRGRWMPTPEDLTADDWAVAKKGGGQALAARADGHAGSVAKGTAAKSGTAGAKKGGGAKGGVPPPAGGLGPAGDGAEKTGGAAMDGVKDGTEAGTEAEAENVAEDETKGAKAGGAAGGKPEGDAK